MGKKVWAGAVVVNVVSVRVLSKAASPPCNTPATLSRSTKIIRDQCCGADPEVFGAEDIKEGPVLREHHACV